MPWNKPANKNHHEPQKKSNTPKGPPDLEALLKQWLEKFKQAFNHLTGGVGGNGSGNKNVGAANYHNIAGLIAIFLVLFWFILGIFIVAPAEQAVVLLFGKYQTTLDSGPHWIPRFVESAYLVNQQKISNYAYESQMLTKDENIVSVSLAVQYRVSNVKDYLFNVTNPHESLQQATASALRQVIGRTTLDDVLTTGRERVRQEVTVTLNDILNRYKAGILVTNVSMQPARAPDEVKEAFDDAIKAREDEQRFINQAQAYAMQVVPIAKGQAQRLLADAKAYRDQAVYIARGDTAGFLALLPAYQKAPAITRERLYLETMEFILTATSKVLINGSGNSLLYLPLDKGWIPPALAENKALPFALDKSNAVTATPLASQVNTLSNVASPLAKPEPTTENQDTYSARGY